MPDGTTSNAFGFEPEDIEGGELFPEASDETQAEAPEEPEVPEPEPVVESEAEPEPVAESTEEPEAPETPEEPQPYVGTYATREAAEEGLRSLRAHATQASQARAEAERRYQGLVQEVTKYKPLLEKLQQMEQQGEAAFEVDFDPTDPAQFEQRLAREREQIRTEFAQQEQARLLREAQATQDREIAQFRSQYPDSMQQPPEVLRDVVAKYHKDDSGQVVFPVTAENLGLAYKLTQRPDIDSLVEQSGFVPDPEVIAHAEEALANPALLETVQANLDWLGSPKGMALARRLAGLPSIVQTANDNATTQQHTQDEEERKAAHVEKGEARSEVDEAPGKKPVDPLEEAMLEDMSRPERSVFGI